MLFALLITLPIPLHKRASMKVMKAISLAPEVLRFNETLIP